MYYSFSGLLRKEYYTVVTIHRVLQSYNDPPEFLVYWQSAYRDTLCDISETYYWRYQPIVGGTEVSLDSINKETETNETGTLLSPFPIRDVKSTWLGR